VIPQFAELQANGPTGTSNGDSGVVLHVMLVMLLAAAAVGYAAYRLRKNARTEEDEPLFS